MSTTVGLIVGSLRKGSYTKAVAEQAAALLPDGYTVKKINIGDLDLYNQDLDDENRVPESWRKFREDMQSVDAVIFATPEYNRSVPGVLKNAIDVGSRPYGASVWDKKPAIILSVSPGAISGFGANHHLRQSLVFLNMPVVQQPEVYLGNVTNILDDNLKITNKGTIGFLQSAMDTFVDLINRFKD
ncbi:NADPH-dependent FMN reductase [Pediococcus ethanolidurans]|uniref:Flavoprotein n=1 Tax=Pediococcus ethanolidurans TaxID=319653 RepID=A0A0R2KAS1_9LACO|nr:NAD(P)H-dependent oxidoreductase [Pediococcus ethanolidurans]KRN83380.1 flavoprotein [Pediococcus ethanolidurans]MBU7554333.1 NAD(P)H-dependent oxidoreductase [Pediococcus ethanolidurans]MBU7563890.1 NAD(P)H-dependent oxidoreductase [Pediococcus ethanolidurans]MCT4398731.1 NADPH-dependent oxidoreductase [Pediococcus ethanolidurans]MCV3316121.1 NAD(P)H-dependent oxidoreductase [Pediococcus ethanolidurans]